MPTEQNKCETPVTVRDLLEQRISALEKLTEELFSCRETALNLQRELTEVQQVQTKQDVDALKQWRDNQQGRQAVVTIVISVIVSLVLIGLDRILRR